MYMVGVDPGTNYCGVAVFEIDDKTFKIKNVYTKLIDLTTPKYKSIDNDVFYRLNKLYENFITLFKELDVRWLAIESSFINRLRPAAYGPLVTSVFVTKKAFMDITGLLSISEIAPMVAKKVIAKNHNAKKDDMTIGVENIPILKKYLTGNESEHEIDAISILYTCYLQLAEKPEKML